MADNEKDVLLVDIGPGIGLPSNVSIPPKDRRPWRTEDEIINIVHTAVTSALTDVIRPMIENQNEILKEVRATTQRQAVAVDKIADGAAEQMYSAVVLHGDPKNGIKGFIPETLEKLSNIEKRQDQAEVKTAENHAVNVAAIAAATADAQAAKQAATDNGEALVSIKADQHKIKNGIVRVWVYVTKKDEKGNSKIKDALMLLLGSWRVWVTSTLIYLATKIPFAKVSRVLEQLADLIKKHS